ncbi:hypothetical protein [Verrucosispora sp. TAA-831]|uniref:hypothetical protein n=1 Tax=Verrucosispora sp. TAA-831 TaxID=3422227 RepID=UPI003D6F5E22
MTASRKPDPAGLPVYRVGEIPDHLATATMLRRLRRRQAEGQQPAATLFYHGNKHTDLYEIAASAAMPALSPGRQAAWTAARTCARCQTTRPNPLANIENGRRLCTECVVIERTAKVRPSWLRLRAAASAWAREVLADPDTVLLAAYDLNGWMTGPLHVHAVTLDGQVLVDVVARRAYPSVEGVIGGIDRVVGGTDANRLVPVLTPLVGRRTIHTIRSHRGHYAGHVTPFGRLSELTRHYWPGLHDPSIRQTIDDDYHLRWTDWHNRTWYNHPHSRPSYGRSGLTSVPVEGEDAAALTTAMLAGLRRMAADAYPDGPPRCPWLPPTGLTPCGATPAPHSGLCPDHTPAEEATGGPA